MMSDLLLSYRVSLFWAFSADVDCDFSVSDLLLSYRVPVFWSFSVDADYDISLDSCAILSD